MLFYFGDLSELQKSNRSTQGHSLLLSGVSVAVVMQGHNSGLGVSMVVDIITTCFDINTPTGTLTHTEHC